MICIQKRITLPSLPRGCHLVTSEILSQLPELSECSTGIINIFIQHTSASLTVNENADPDVRYDMESHLNKVFPENAPHYRHTCEGSDDMPAHLKSSVLGAGLSLPVTRGQLNLGTWQGIYLCEHRNHGGRRSLVVTILGQ